jgi:hypothetical protein
MAVVGGGSAGGRVFADVSINNDADRVIYMQKQVGSYLTWLPLQGRTTDRRAGFEGVNVEADPIGAIDGVTLGDQRLQSAAAIFRSDMVGKKITIDGMERTVTIFTSSTEVEVSGDALPADTGRVYSVDGGILAGDQSVSSGGQVLNATRVPAADGRTRLRWAFGKAV